MVNKQYIISRQYPNTSNSMIKTNTSTTTTPLNGFPSETLSGQKKCDQIVTTDFKVKKINRNLDQFANKETIHDIGRFQYILQMDRDLVS